MAANKGDKVSVHYKGMLDDGTEFDSSYDREPLEFTIGEGMLIPGFEEAVVGKNEGDKVTVVIKPENAYGLHNEELVALVPRAEVPEHITPEVGMMLQVNTEEGELEVMITHVDEEEVELDGNHPLAGQTLTFNIELVKVL